ncbi:hypothetical protein HDU67_005869 [Dinochytrium kinnereticum]|nr:hypothetical protein HDU67_005869 [Dinochytrium kinnereticum]
MDRHILVISAIQTTLNGFNLTFNDLVRQVQRVRENKARRDEAEMEGLSQLFSTRLKLSTASTPVSCGRFKRSLIRSDGHASRLHKIIKPAGMKTKTGGRDPRLRLRMAEKEEVKPASRQNKSTGGALMSYYEFRATIGESTGDPFRNEGEMRKCFQLAVNRVWGIEEKMERSYMMQC